MTDKFTTDHVQGTLVYCAQHGKGRIVAIADGVVHVQFAKTRGRFSAVDGASGTGQTLHFFGKQ
ncbi:MAG: hypothetical protein IBX55_14030 [Methyloprofundus sp.]|nr:hypothetical protein [Methyloprofundus sp.]